MPSHTVVAGDSWAKIAGQYYGDQRRYLDLANANGGLGMLHPGDVINIPDFSGAPAPVITNKEWANTPTGVKNGQVQYANAGYTGNQPAAAGTSAQAGKVALPSTTGVQLPTFTPSGPHGTGSAGANPNAVRGQKQTKPKVTKPGFRTPQTSNYYPNPAAGAQPYGQAGAGYNANPLLWGQLPPAKPNGKPGSPTGPMGNGAGPAAGMYPPSGPSAAVPSGQDVYRPFGTVLPDFVNWLTSPNGTYNPPPADSMQPTLPTGFGMQNYRPSLPGAAGVPPTSANAANAAYAARYSGQAGQSAAGGGYQAPPAGGQTSFPQPKSDVAPNMAQVADAARYTGMAIYAYGGGYSDRGLAGGDRNTLPTIIHALVAAQLPRPPGMSDADYMLLLGYSPDENGNYVRNDPGKNQGGYGGGAFDTQSAQPADYGFGGYGGSGYGGYPSYGRSAPTTQPYGLVNWRITG